MPTDKHGSGSDAAAAVREGEILHVPPHVPHQAEAIEDTFTLDLFCPIRPEWLDQPAAPDSPAAAASEEA